MLRQLVELLVLLAVVVALAALVALILLATGRSAHRAFTLVFYVGGGVMFLFALLTRGSESRAYGLGPGVGLIRRHHVREDERTLNPTGALALAGVLLLALGVVFDATL